MPRIIKSLGKVLLAFLTFVPVASAQRRGGFRGGFGGGLHSRVFVGGRFYGPSFWGPGWNDPYYYGGYYAPPVGEVQIKTRDKGNLVYVDDGFAGRTGELKNFHLQPGTHTVELRGPNGASFYQERINVLAGKTIEIQPDMPPSPDLSPARWDGSIANPSSLPRLRPTAPAGAITPDPTGQNHKSVVTVFVPPAGLILYWPACCVTVFGGGSAGPAQ